MTRHASGTRLALPRAPSYDESDPTTLYETRQIEIIEAESPLLVAALRRARWWNALLALVLAAIVTFAVAYWLGGGR